ncbi:MAG: tRNA uridine-5-carboxymethylaminomethyl(34) synthesis GTPase MnmE [Clostridiales Family XIII bacterium]|jgi:tRNA modification GTPase|nr:tRNA uridine-5-carboxymethylaminomethyl(34) synthesis GTPase MnmE [Clostridiales Family XIII bacterium]
MGETIAAVSTAPGEGGIGIVRISGENAARILEKMFAPLRGKAAANQGGFPDKKMMYGHIKEPSSAQTVDEVLAVFMKAPHSYTGEDVAEIQCHGGPVPLRRILEISYELGAVPAAPGEFTKRAFLNGRIDLVQAGAVIDLIRAKTERSYRAAKDQAEGKLSARIRAVRGGLLGVLAEITARIDYPEAFEEEGGGTPDPYLPMLKKAGDEAGALLADADAGRLVRDGVRAAIIGKPNTGKSSLFNAMARESAAIVTDIPGTTRDAIEIFLNISGVPVILTDTAGIREAAGEVETLGIRKSRSIYERADIALFVLDGSLPLSAEDREIAASLNPEKKTILVVNKRDLPPAFDLEEAAALLSFPAGIAETSLFSRSLPSLEEGNGGAATGFEAGFETDGAAELEKEIAGRVFTGAVSAGGSLLVTKARHKAALLQAKEEIEEAVRILSRGDAPEFAEVNVRAAYDTLGEMIGETVTEDILDRVFEEFCIGK